MSQILLLAEWRTNYKKKTGKTVRRNTAIMELKLLAMIIRPCRQRQRHRDDIMHLLRPNK
jgi:hypothetical protein